MSVISEASTFYTEVDEPAERSVNDAECVRIRAGGHVPRQRHPWLSAGYAPLAKERLVYYDQQQGYQQLRRAYMTDPQSWDDEVVRDTLVLSIAAVQCDARGCRHGRSCPQYGWGVSFGLGSGRNWQGTLDAKYPSYDVCGLLEGLQQAFAQIVKIVEAEPKIVRIRTTSKAFVQIMAWEMEFDKRVQKHFDKVSELWRQMESHYRITIQLWLVDPGEVSDAEHLALAALCS